MPNLLRILLFTGGFCLSLIASANPIDVTYDNVEYAVTYETLSSSQLNILTSQPWYNNPTAAGIFADQVGTSDGLPNGYGGYAAGPFFAVQYNSFGQAIFGQEDVSGNGVNYQVESAIGLHYPDLSDENYAIASVVPDSTPTCIIMTIPALSLIVLRRYLRPQPAAV